MEISSLAPPCTCRAIIPSGILLTLAIVSSPTNLGASCQLCISSSMNREQHIYGDLLLLPFLFFLGVALDPLPAWIGFFTTAVSLSSSSSANICTLVCLTTFGAPAL